MMEDRILYIYNDIEGVNLLFLKYIKKLIDNNGYIFDSIDRLDKVKKILKEEFDAILLLDDQAKIVFKNKQSKVLFMIKFN
jgi:hypothetical protein